MEDVEELRLVESQLQKQIGPGIRDLDSLAMLGA